MKFRTFAKKANLVKHVDHEGEGERIVYTPPKGHIVMYNDQAIAMVIHYPAYVEKNELGGIVDSYDESYQIIPHSEDDEDDYDEYGVSPDGKWALYKKVSI